MIQCACQALSIATLLHSLSSFYQLNNLQTTYDLIVLVMVECICSKNDLRTNLDGKNFCFVAIAKLPREKTLLLQKELATFTTQLTNDKKETQLNNQTNTNTTRPQEDNSTLDNEQRESGKKHSKKSSKSKIKTKLQDTNASLITTEKNEIDFSKF
ncbi:hypothetical protein RFI_24474 [Reticulomyxa filosa]|uniref:Uncharacterized protein n=1 Tax=Reticulomyxa filosa TaxID=46433 RepID=X6MIN7_RETFI|nr:hypothetical protein RFI_24474 [Reticulomyxa filosa]|eukprot:ETO12900.1 hypothetical protein RFI_24474 [Reticulomyxa filosa]